jgi:hypothetical protein
MVHGRPRSSCKHLLACWFLALALLPLLVGGCAPEDYRAIAVEAGPASAIRLATLWEKIAEAGQFDPSGAGLRSLWLEYSTTGTLLSARIQAFTFLGQFVQVGFLDGDRLGGDPVFVSGGVSSGSTFPSYALPPAAQLFAAIDTVGPGSMIALLKSSGPGERYAVSFARLAVPAEAIAYFWDGSGFDSLASTDSRRMHSSDCVYLEAYSATPVSSPSLAGSDTTATSEFQGSGQATYFVIPT